MSFKAITGQDQPIKILKAYISEDRMEGGFLFCGPEGVGKKATAKILAAVLNCDEGALEPCNKCTSCLKIANNQHPDVHIIETDSSEIKIEAVRLLQKEINYRPYEGKRKVFIIDNAHSLNADASNALLKTLEEPPKNSLIILISDKPAVLFRTIISRCKLIKFSALAREELYSILKNEFRLESGLAHFLAYFSEGRLGRALKLKESQVLRDKNTLLDRFVIFPNHNLDNLKIEDKEALRAFLNILAAWFRDVYLIKSGMQVRGAINFDRKDELSLAAGQYSFTELNSIINSISSSFRYMEQNMNTRLLLHNLGAQLWKA